MAGSSSSTANSTESHKTVGLFQYEAEEKGIPSLCYCGMRAIIVQSKTAANPGRLFFSCVRAARRGDTECHIFKWVDEAMVEEAVEMKTLARDIRVHMNNVEVLRTNFDQQMKALASKGKCVMVGVLVAMVGVVAIYLLN